MKILKSGLEVLMGMVLSFAVLTLALFRDGIDAIEVVIFAILIGVAYLLLRRIRKEAKTFELVETMLKSAGGGLLTIYLLLVFVTTFNIDVVWFGFVVLVIPGGLFYYAGVNRDAFDIIPS